MGRGIVSAAGDGCGVNSEEPPLFVRERSRRNDSFSERLDAFGISGDVRRERRAGFSA